MPSLSDWNTKISGCLGVFISTGFTKKPLTASSAEIVIQTALHHLCRNEEADTDKTLMASNIKQAYIDSSLRYYRDLVAGGVHG